MSEQQTAIDRQMVVAQGRQLTVVGNAVRVFDAKPETVQHYIEEYGIEAVEHALELKDEGLDFKIGKFMSIVAQGFASEEVVVFYNTYYTFLEIIKEGDDKKQGASLVMITQMARQFSDFREMATEDQVDVLRRLQEIFHKMSRFAMEKTISRAEDLSIFDVEHFLELMESFSDGSLWSNWGFDEDATGVYE